MTLSPLEKQMLHEVLKNKFESIEPAFELVFDDFIHLYRLTVKLGCLDLAEEFNDDFRTCYGFDLKTLI